MNLASKTSRRWPVSYALPAFACTALWLFITIWLPASEMPQEDVLAPVAAAHTGTAWPEPAVRDEAVAQSELAPTF